MYVSPFLSRDNSNTPKEYKSKARDEITLKLKIQPSPLASTLNKSKDLRHGSSPLAKVTNASDTLSRVNSNDSIDSQDTSISDEKHKRSFGLSKLKQHMSTSSFRSKHQTAPLSSTSSNLNIVHEQETVDVEMRDAPQDSIYSKDSNLFRTSTDNQSILTNNTFQQSLFSHQNSLATQLTNVSAPQPNSHYSKPAFNQQVYLTLEEALPKLFEDMYSQELLSNPTALVNGRPSFTKRPLQDWELNDVRSLLIVCELKPDWGSELPVIYSPQGFKMEYLPLNSNDDQIIRTLVKCDIYKESNFDSEFRIQTARYTVFTARSRHAQLMQELNLPNDGKLSKPEWRNIIENFMLNLAVESQCRLEYKKAVGDLKRFRKAENASRDKGNLLKKALLNESALQVQGHKLNKEEKFQLWKGVQSNVYKRLGLDWKPDN